MESARANFPNLSCFADWRRGREGGWLRASSQQAHVHSSICSLLAQMEHAYIHSLAAHASAVEHVQMHSSPTSVTRFLTAHDPVEGSNLGVGEPCSRKTFTQLWLVTFLPQDDLVIVTTWMDYCNVLYMGLPLSMTQKLQLVENAVVKWLVEQFHLTRITLILKWLH